MVADSGQLVEHEFTGATGHIPLVWFEMVWLNHSSRIIFIMPLIIVIIYYQGILYLIKLISKWKLVMLFSVKFEC